MKYQRLPNTTPSYSPCVVYNNGTGQIVIPDSYEALQSRCLQKKNIIIISKLESATKKLKTSKHEMKAIEQ